MPLPGQDPEVQVPAAARATKEEAAEPVQTDSPPERISSGPRRESGSRGPVDDEIVVRRVDLFASRGEIVVIPPNQGKHRAVMSVPMVGRVRIL